MVPAAGREVLTTRFSGGAMNPVFRARTNRRVGGKPFASILEGGLLEPAVGMKIHRVYLDTHALGGLGQLFTSFDQADEAAQ